MLRLDTVTLTVGTRELLRDACLDVHPGDRIGLVGPNGSGKTSLLRAIVGELDVEAGRVVRSSGARLGYLPQTAVSGSTATVWEEARSGMVEMNRLEARLRAAEEAVAAAKEGAVERLDAATEAFRIAGGYAAEARVGEVLHGLGFGPDAWVRSCDTFSGGWQMRIALARTLLSEPDLLLLDEPTNHLDLAARTWLASFLANSPSSFILVSHDRHLLDRATNRTVEVRAGTLESFAGNLTAWTRERAARDAQLRATAARQQDEIAKLERFVERFGAKATKAAQAKSKQKALDRIERVEVGVERKAPRLKLPDPPSTVAELIALEGVDAGWADDAVVLRGVRMRLERGMRVALLGPNGAGKSTLLHSLAGDVSWSRGRRVVGQGVRIGVYRQDLAQDLPADLSAVDAVLLRVPAATPERARAALGALGLSGDAALRPVGVLSGGEKARIVLATFALRAFDVLLLDEPSNHLDAQTVEVLAAALGTWEGAVVFASHDRYLVEQVATHTARIESGALQLRAGVHPEDLAPQAARQGDREAATGPGVSTLAERKQIARDRRALQRRIASLTKEMEAAEVELTRLDGLLADVGDDWERSVALGMERDAAEAKMEAAFEALAASESELEDLDAGG